MSKRLLDFIRIELKTDKSIVIPDLMRFGLREVSTKHKQHIQLVGQNAKLAAENMRASTELEALQSQVKELQARVQSKHSQYAKVKQELIQIQRTMTPEYAVNALSHAAEEIDNRCMDMADEFVEEDLEIKPFTTEFLKARELYHKRTALLELNRGP